MIAEDAILILSAAFETQRVGLDADDRTEYDFANDEMYFVATQLGPQAIRLMIPLGGLSTDTHGLTRLLEGNCLGHESGPTQLAWSTIDDQPALVACIDLSLLDIDLFQERVTDFLIYAHYWQIEGPALIRGGTSALQLDDHSEMTTIRV